MQKRKSIEIPTHVAPIMKSIGEKVSEIRKTQFNINYRTFAENNDISVMTLWRIQNGEDCRLSTFLNILSKLNITPEEFFRGIK